MKKLLPLVLILLSSCAVIKPAAPDNRVVLEEHVAPIKIFGIGRYAANSIILTLVDAQNKYFTIEAPVDTNLKIGNVYALAK